MRGRRARVLHLVPSDVPILQHIARSRSEPWFHVQHARILLAVHAGQRIQTIAMQMQCDPATVWRICRRYEQHGIAAILQDNERTGRPQRISPPPARPNRGTGLLGTDRQRIAHHALEQLRPGSPSSYRRNRRCDQSPYRPTTSSRRGFATASHALLENGSSGY